MSECGWLSKYSRWSVWKVPLMVEWTPGEKLNLVTYISVSCEESFTTPSTILPPTGASSRANTVHVDSGLMVARCHVGALDARRAVGYSCVALCWHKYSHHHAV